MEGCTCIRRGRGSHHEDMGVGNEGTSFVFLSIPRSRFSVRFKESSVTVKVIQGSRGGENGKLSCKKKGSHGLEVTV